MGEARARSRNRKQILVNNPRCIYCFNLADTIEHMPPRAMFRKKARPSGLEFPCCKACNEGTKAADIVATFISKIELDPIDDGWRTKESLSYTKSIHQLAPGLLGEMFDDNRVSTVVLRRKSGLLTRAVEIRADGPLVHAYLNIFSAKLAMALFAEHTQKPLDKNGIAQTIWFLNAGVPREATNSLLDKMPHISGLKQGKFNSNGQFDYKYNTDFKSIFGALVKFHEGLIIFMIVASHEHSDSIVPIDGPTEARTKIGELLNMIPLQHRKP